MKKIIVGIFMCTLMIAVVPAALGTTLNQEPNGKMAAYANSPPNTPTINGQTNGKLGVNYNYTFVTTDPDGDNVYYWIEWGDGCPSVQWIGPYASGQVVTQNHTFGQRGTFTISCQAEDIYNATSDWGMLSVTMPRARSIDSPFLQLLLERFPHAFPILRHLMGL